MTKETKKELTRRKIIILLLDMKKRTQKKISKELEESEAYISPILSKLDKKDKIIKRISKTKQGTNYPVYHCTLNPDAFQDLAEEFLNFDYAVEFIRSKYAQHMINSELLRELEKTWQVKKPFRKKEDLKQENADRKSGVKKHISAFIDGEPTVIGSTNVESPFNRDVESKYVFTEEDVLQILKISPVALQKILNGPNERGGETCFKETLLASLILDFTTSYHPGHWFKAKIEVELSEYRAEAEPFLHKKVDIPIYHPSLPPYGRQLPPP